MSRFELRKAIMSTRSLNDREGRAPLTDPKWYPTTQGLNRWLNRMAERRDITVRVLKHTSGAPARFVPTSAEIDINEGLIARIDPRVAGSPDFIVKHRAIAGACIHEAAHARHSTMNLPGIAKVHGDRHTGVFAMLEEGRCETQQWPHLSELERDALQSMVLDIVLHDMQDEEGEVRELNIGGCIRLVGLLAARIERGIVDITQPMAERLHKSLIDVLGADYTVLAEIAIEFSRVELGYYSSREDDLHDLVRQWIEVEDRLNPQEDNESGEGGDESGDESGEGGGGEGEGTSKSKSKSKSDESSEDGEGEGEGNGDGDSKSEDGESPIGDDDDGTVGDGSHTQTESEGEAALGQYGSTKVDEALADIFDSIRDAAEEAERVSGSRLREHIVATHRATAASHAERRRKNAEYRKRWHK